MPRTAKPLMLVFVLLLGAPVFAQTGTAQASSNSEKMGAGDAAILDLLSSAGPLMGVVSAPVINHPYSADQLMERVQTLPDGTHINQNLQSAKLYRDSQGRTRTEEMGGNTDWPNLIVITDPVGGYQYLLNPNTHIARRTVFKQRTLDDLKASIPADLQQASAPLSRPKPQTSTESLGSQLIQGVSAEGTRTTTTIPVGSIGNDKPITNVHESWRSSDLQIVVLSKTSAPQMGDMTTKLENISLAEPDASLFQVPAGYEFRDTPASK
jgi:hypothetical protein